MLKTENIKALCSTDTFDNGRRLCRPGKIRKVQTVKLDRETVKARGLVLGNFGFYHTVRLVLNLRCRNIVESYECDCYELTRTNEPCRHCVALAMALAENGEVDLGCKLEPVDAGVDQEFPSDAAVSGLTTAEQERMEPEKTPSNCELQVTGEAAPVLSDAAGEEQAESVEDTEYRGMEILLGYECSESAGIPDMDVEGAESETVLPDVPVYWLPNDTAQVFHTNTGIIGTMGTGKTQFTKSLITQLYRQQRNNYNGHPLDILIFDYKGDYNETKQDFVKATNAKVLRLHQLPINPLAFFETRNYKPLLPVHTANTFKDTISTAFRLGPKQQTVLFKCIMKAYEAVGIDAALPETWKKRAPTFDMVYQIYDKDDEIPKNDSLAAAMQKIQAFQLFESKPFNTAALFDVLNGVVVIDLSGYDPDLQSLTVAIMLDQFYSQMLAAGSSETDGTLRQLTKMILVDEADNFMSEGFPALKKILKEGREFGVGTILSTQFLDHFTSGEDDYAKYILTWAVHNVGDLKKSDVEYIFKTRLNGSDTMQIFQRIKSLDRFQSAVKIGNSDVVYIREKPFFEIAQEDTLS